MIFQLIGFHEGNYRLGGLHLAPPNLWPSELLMALVHAHQSSSSSSPMKLLPEANAPAPLGILSKIYRNTDGPAWQQWRGGMLCQQNRNMC